MNDFAKHQLAGLAALAAVVEIAMRALVESYPELWCEPRSTDPPEVRSADALVDLCGRLLNAIDQHRHSVAGRLPREDQYWPF